MDALATGSDDQAISQHNCDVCGYPRRASRPTRCVPSAASPRPPSPVAPPRRRPPPTHPPTPPPPLHISVRSPPVSCAWSPRRSPPSASSW